MNRDDIISIAWEAGLLPGEHTERLERFAAIIEQHLIASGYRKCAEGQRETQHCGLLEQAVLAEREACARVCDGIRYKGYVPPEDGAAADYYDDASTECAAAIRARK